ncbi:hypothetical protein DENSPDRAFT_886278 [Dentipellis sp. KUC8613]|nr:hypothetical protein DENSPDRAFT_886278 [Dentipellis sp. KUC8613]
MPYLAPHSLPLPRAFPLAIAAPSALPPKLSPCRLASIAWPSPARRYTPSSSSSSSSPSSFASPSPLRLALTSPPLWALLGCLRTPLRPLDAPLGQLRAPPLSRHAHTAVFGPHGGRLAPDAPSACPMGPSSGPTVFPVRLTAPAICAPAPSSCRRAACAPPTVIALRDGVCGQDAPRPSNSAWRRPHTPSCRTTRPDAALTPPRSPIATPHAPETMQQQRRVAPSPRVFVPHRTPSRRPVRTLAALRAPETTREAASAAPSAPRPAFYGPRGAVLRPPPPSVPPAAPSVPPAAPSVRPASPSQHPASVSQHPAARSALRRAFFWRREAQTAPWRRLLRPLDGPHHRLRAPATCVCAASVAPPSNLLACHRHVLSRCCRVSHAAHVSISRPSGVISSLVASCRSRPSLAATHAHSTVSRPNSAVSCPNSVISRPCERERMRSPAVACTPHQPSHLPSSAFARCPMPSCSPFPALSAIACRRVHPRHAGPRPR